MQRAAILDEAIRILDEEGPGALSMRTLAGRLGVGTMSLYHYVADRDELLDGIAERLLGTLQPTLSAEQWAEDLLALSERFRALTHQHRNAFVVLLGRRPSPAILALTAQVLAQLEACGFRRSEARMLYRALVRLLVGWCMAELHGVDKPPSPAAADREFRAAAAALIHGVAAQGRAARR